MSAYYWRFIMEKKTNRTIRFWIGLLLFGLGESSLTSQIPNNHVFKSASKGLLSPILKNQAIQDVQVVDSILRVANDRLDQIEEPQETEIITRSSPKNKNNAMIHTLAKVAQLPRHVFSVFNNIVDFFRLSDDIGTNEPILKELEKLEVKVSERKVPYGTSRFIPKNATHEYTLGVRAPRKYLPHVIAKIPAETWLKAQLLKVAQYASFLVQADFEYDFHCKGSSELVGNILAENPQIANTLNHLGHGDFREASKSCSMWFEPETFTFKFSLPKMENETESE